MRKPLLWGLFGLAVLVTATLQFIPPAPVVVPAQLPAEQRAEHRVLGFEGIHNFRDLGGYRTADGRQVSWGKLYRAGDLSEASRFDLEQLQKLDLNTLIDFRSGMEKEAAPDRLPEPAGFEVVEIPTLDEGNSALVEEMSERVETGNFEGFDASALMTEANRQFASDFTPQFREFMHTLVAADGQPVLWHCTAGKDRTGFAAAILLELLGVPRETILNDYMLSNDLSLAARSRDLTLLRLFKGEEAEQQVAIMLGVQRPWLEAAFTKLEERWGSFDNYVHEGLQLSDEEIASLRANLLD